MYGATLPNFGRGKEPFYIFYNQTTKPWHKQPQFRVRFLVFGMLLSNLTWVEPSTSACTLFWFLNKDRKPFSVRRRRFAKHGFLLWGEKLLAAECQKTALSTKMSEREFFFSWCFSLQQPCPDIKCEFYELLHQLLLHNWRYFFRSSLLARMSAGEETVENQPQFTAVMQVCYKYHAYKTSTGWEFHYCHLEA